MRLIAATMSLALLAAAEPVLAEMNDPYPVIPEPMIFDMMRPLGARRGELEVNALALTSAPFRPRDAEWAPEVEYAFADGKAIELELPFDGGRLAALKVGLQTALGAFADGRTANGLQYIGVYDRGTQHYSSSLLYMAGHRFSPVISTMTMVGLDDISFGRAARRNAFLFNQSVFFDVRPGSVVGIELNVSGGAEELVRVGPQVHQRLTQSMNVQVAAGAEGTSRHPLKPFGGLRLVREF